MVFQYWPLNPNEIRLLKPLSRSPGSLSFEIVHVSLISNPGYAALSYTWGLPGDAYRILLSGQVFPIRQNLCNALQQICNSNLVEEYLWVDAICINQGENTDALNERSVQITLMKQVYEQATKVLVWLGQPENEDNNRLAFPLMKDFHRRLNHVVNKARPYRPWWWPSKSRTSNEDLADFLLSVSPAKDKTVFDVPGSQTYRAWLGIISLWKSPWWTRTWVYQEASIPEQYKTFFVKGSNISPVSSKVRFLCGDQETSWSDLAATSNVAANIIGTPGLDSNFLVGSATLFEKFARFRSLRVQNNLGSFLEILQMFRRTECFDPRDKVYAPLGLAPDDFRRYIIPDYSNKTVLDVYIDVVRYCLAQPRNNLDFLGYAFYQEEGPIVLTPKGVRSVLPSWVPNFSVGLDIFPIPKVLHIPQNLDGRRIRPYDTSGVPSNKEEIVAAYRPLGDTPSRYFINSNLLYLSGVYIDTLKDMLPHIGPDLEVIRTISREKGRQWAIESKHKYFNGESFVDAVNRTLVLDLIKDDRARASERGGKLDSAFLCRPRAELSLKEYMYQMNMRRAQHDASVLRKLAFSQKMYLAMVPHTAVAGDSVWALAGGQSLYILRPTNWGMNGYRFIGECYTHGLMDGEILRKLQVGELRVGDISLV